MTAPLKLTADQLRDLSQFITIISRATRDSGVRISPHTGMQLACGDSIIEVRWNHDTDEYVVDDRNGL